MQKQRSSNGIGLELYGESKLVVMFGGFHIEQAFLKVLGQFLISCGWVGAIGNSGIATEAPAESCLKVTHVTKARGLHQVTACALYQLLRDAYLANSSDGSMEAWIVGKAALSPTFLFWLTVLNLQVILLSFVRSLREGNYILFKTSLKKMIPWFFLFDHTNYSRWLPVHMKDLEELPTKAPDVDMQFHMGNFVIRKTSNPFSALAIDQGHEQNNAP